MSNYPMFDAYWRDSVTGTLMQREAERRQSGFIRRTTYKPVRHDCGHFECRRMGFDVDPELGYATAGSPCSECAPQGRTVQPHYSDLTAAHAECMRLNCDLR
jgi:hypothetical protein